ncbi:hypothetical protein LF1_31510 [Rubripirellula obstinata]|uniref:DUF5722 domain-containing protein n=1 Tax=Rubripirellula obstinata TaxID=406547 RepID=A0A5B1CJZ3_9BACT|nr:DUF5722 domain-containing protein [Rubripirellula obstinata]KAA1260611.1 hypothetical protein LF1_31510 [Rubripirellula obstinata]
MQFTKPNSLAIYCVVCAFLAQTQTSAQNFRVIPDKCKDVEISQRDDVLEIKTIGKDPFLVGDLVGVGANDSVLEMEVFAADGVRGFEVYLGPPFSKQARSQLPPIPESETWTTYQSEIDPEVIKKLRKPPEKMRLDLGKQEGVRLQIRAVRLRPLSAADRKARLEALRIEKERESRATKISRYLKLRYRDRIETVVVSDDKILLAGKTLSSKVDESEIQIMECPAWTDVTDDPSAFPVNATLKLGAKTWNATIPRYDGKRDRLHSSWRLSFQDRFLTARRFPTTIQTKGKNHVKERPVPFNQKGLGGIDRASPMEELPELGISAITVNILLSAFLVDKPGPGREVIPLESPSGFGSFDGENSSDDIGPVYFNPAAFRPLDATMMFARKHKIIVSGILLVPANNKQSAASMLIHPDNDGGVYSMPNLTNARSAEAYAYVLNRLARRYSNPSKPPGGITNWIVQNEVDHHHQWTNMGKQPRALVTEAYYRSMRMIYNATRQYNPHARVFASLTHSWMVDEAVGKGTRLSPREVLITLQRYSLVEGDFDWGVAYHPYPQSLFAATAWNDTKVTDGLDTPFITIQNIEVLEKFLAHRLMLNAARQPRPILLSEQGFHTDSYDTEAQANQAGSLAYAMRKIAKMPTVESFHYHRWIDHPKEGGLKMGLRTLPTPGNPHGEKKQSWYVYQAIATPDEKQATENLPGPSE